MTSHVLQVDRSDGQGFVLFNIRSGTRNELDIEIEGTEGTVPYFTRFKHHHIEKALHKSSNLSDEEWTTVTRCLLLQVRPSGPDEANLLQGIEVNVQVSDDKLVLAFRKNISGIHQRLADLTIPKDEDHELDTISWVSTAVQRATTLEIETRSLRDEVSQQAQAMQKLQEQIEELIQAKNDHETELLEKFSRLINSKKAKIRDQQRLLNGMHSTSKTGSVRDVPMTDPDDNPTKKKPAPQPGKRKSAPSNQDSAPDHAASSDTESASDASRQATEDEDEENTASEAEAEPELEEVRPVIATRADTEAPPRRELPFKNRLEAMNKPSRPKPPRGAPPSEMKQAGGQLDGDSDNEL